MTWDNMYLYSLTRSLLDNMYLYSLTRSLLGVHTTLLPLFLRICPGFLTISEQSQFHTCQGHVASSVGNEVHSPFGVVQCGDPAVPCLVRNKQG